jgi:hypothetical protein
MTLLKKDFNDCDPLLFCLAAARGLVRRPPLPQGSGDDGTGPFYAGFEAPCSARVRLIILETLLKHAAKQACDACGRGSMPSAQPLPCTS